MLKITIDDRQYDVEEGMTVLEVAREKDIHIPTFCYHPALKPSGSCKLCTVEVAGRSGRQLTLLSCVLRVKDGLVVKTKGELVKRSRIKAFQQLLQMAPQSKVIRDLAEEYGIDLGPPPDGCVRCRLCIRVCKEIVGPSALKMEKRDGKNYVVPVEGLCIGCGTCANICPTKVIRVEDVGNVRTISVRDEIIGRHPLIRCEGCGSMFATPKFIEHIEKRVTPHPEVKERHQYCPTCAKFFSDRIKSFKDRKQRLPGHH